MVAKSSLSSQSFYLSAVGEILISPTADAFDFENTNQRSNILFFSGFFPAVSPWESVSHPLSMFWRKGKQTENEYFDEQLNKNRLVWHTDSTGWGLGNRSWLINYGLYLTRLKRFGKKSKNGNERSQRISAFALSKTFFSVQCIQCII